MTNIFNLKAVLRNKIGSAESRRLRKAGQIPAIICNKNQKNFYIAINVKDFEQEYFKGNIFTTIITIDLDGKKLQVIPNKVDVNPLSDRPNHVDFVSVDQDNKDAKIKAKTKLVFTNQDKSPGIKKGGFLHIVLRKINLLCDYDKVPEKIEIDVGAMQVGNKIRALDLKLPQGTKLVEKGNFIIASVIGRGKAEEEVVAVPTAEGAVAGAAVPGAPAAGGAAAAAPATGATAGDKKEGDKKQDKKPEKKSDKK